MPVADFVRLDPASKFGPDLGCQRGGGGEGRGATLTGFEPVEHDVQHAYYQRLTQIDKIL